MKEVSFAKHCVIIYLVPPVNAVGVKHISALI